MALTPTPFPIQLQRQFTGPLDADIVFASTAARIAYLSKGVRYAGQVVSDLEIPGQLFQLNAARNAWITIGGAQVIVAADITDSTAAGREMLTSEVVILDGGTP